jgi:hypothetical protein
MSDFESAAAWSVRYQGVPYDDARKVGGVWWYRSQIATEKFCVFLSRIVSCLSLRIQAAQRDPDLAH